MLNQLLKLVKPSPDNKFDIHQPGSSVRIGHSLREIIAEARALNNELVVLCIGTDRSTGDSLGPLTGTKLKTLRAHPYIYGTLEQPVHATNLPETLKLIQGTFANPFVIAVDACLGKMDSIGCVSLGRGSLKPGAAVNKELPSVGDAYITGIVNVGGFMEHLVLQSTRLSLVIKMADVIAYSLAYSLGEHN